jgi:hypothetical protein
LNDLGDAEARTKLAVLETDAERAIASGNDDRMRSAAAELDGLYWRRRRAIRWPPSVRTMHEGSVGSLRVLIRRVNDFSRRLLLVRDLLREP